MVGRPFGTDEPVDNNVTPLEGFAKRQAAVRATRYLASPMTALGSSMMAYGSSPKPITYISHVRRQTPYDKRMQTGKGFQTPYTDSAGRSYTRPLGRKSPITVEHGYDTGGRKDSNKRSRKRIRSKTLAVGGGALWGIGKALPIIGYGYVAYSLYDDYRSGRIKEPQDAGRQLQTYTFGMTLEEAANTGKGLMNTYRTYSPTGIAARGLKKAAEAAAEAFS